MKKYRIGVLYGDGIGPEITEATVSVLKAATQAHLESHFEWVRLPMGWEAIQEYETALPADTIQQLAACHAWIMGPHDSVSYPPEMRNLLNPSGQIRKHFDLYANIRPARNFPMVPSRASNIDLVIVRENTEGFYADRNMYVGEGEFMPTSEIALAVGVFTKKACERIAHVACQLAQSRRKQVTIVHKANVLKLSTGLFLDSCRAVSEQYPDVRVDDYHIDAMAAHLIRRPSSFDVIVTTNMFGDILSDLTAELAGSLGIAGSLNVGERYAMAQAVHGAAPDIAGQDVANPMGLLCSAMMLLEWLGKKYENAELSTLVKKLEISIHTTLSSGLCTGDLGGNASTKEFTQCIITHLLQSM